MNRPSPESHQIDQVNFSDLEALVQFSGNLLGIANQDGYFEYLNAAWERVLGFNRSKLMSCPIIDFVHPNDREKTLQNHERVLHGQDFHGASNRMRTADGNYKWIEWSVSKGEDGRFFFSARDKASDSRAHDQVDALIRTFGNHAIVAVTDRAGKILTANEEFCKVSGYSEDELVGTSHKIVNSGHHDKNFFMEMWQTLARNKIWRGEIMNRNKSGAPYWVDTTIFPVQSPNGRVEKYVAIRHDITEKKLVTEKTERDARLFHETADMSGVGTWELDLISNALFWDNQTKVIHGVDEGFQPDLESAIHFYAPEAQGIINYAVETAIQTGDPWDLELPFITAQGKNIWVRAVGRAISENGMPVKLVGAFQEITLRKEHETVLQRMREQAFQANTAKSEFLTRMSHELRTPLNGIMGMTEILDTTETKEGRKKIIDVIKQSGHTLLELVDDLLDLSQRETGSYQIQPETIDLKSLTQSVMAKFKATCENKGLDFNLSINDNVPAQIFSDKKILTQSLSSLIDNAIKFTEEGRVSVDLSLREDGLVQFSVSDTGIGVPEKDLDIIFDAFTQGGDVVSRKHGGSGIGLSIVKDYVSMLSGEYGLDSEMKCGSKFWFSIPQSYSASKPQTDPEPLNETQDRSKLAEGKVALIVDDTVTNRLVCASLLKELGFKTIECENGNMAINALESMKIDVVFMDLHMPKMSGRECIEIIRNSNASYRDIPIAVLSADVSQNSFKMATVTGADAYGTKPISLHSLTKISQTLLDK